jgi:glucosamine--fructose-6-phosphate aminotransferase (isomerizing)
VTGQIMQAEMAEQPAVLAAFAGRFEAEVQAVAGILPEAPAGTMLLGRGSSDNAATLGRYLAERASGRPAGLSAASLHTRYGAETDYRGYLVVAFSQSGRTPEIVDAAQQMRRQGARVVAVTNETASPLAEVGHAVIGLGAGPERAVPATKTVTSQMLAAIAVACALADGAGRPEARPLTRADLDLLPGAVARMLNDPAPAAELAGRWSARRQLLVVARGLLYPAAAEIALKVREAATVFAQGMSSADLLHGPIASVGRDTPVLLLDGGGPGAADVARLAERLALGGVDHALCAPDAAAALQIDGSLSEAPAAVLAAVRGQQLAWEWARAAGLDPDFPAGLSKVTATT